VITVLDQWQLRAMVGLPVLQTTKAPKARGHSRQAPYFTGRPLARSQKHSRAGGIYLGCRAPLNRGEALGASSIFGTNTMYMADISESRFQTWRLSGLMDTGHMDTMRL